MDEYLKYLTAWMQATANGREQAKAAAEGEIKFAELMIKNLLLLNGGGLVAIPAAMTVIGAKFESDAWYVLRISLLFGTGIIAALLAIVAAYFAMAYLGQAHSARADKAGAEVGMSMAGYEHKAAFNAAVLAMVKADRFARRNRGSAIFLCFLSLGLFIGGTALGVRWASSRPVTEPGSVSAPAATPPVRDSAPPAGP